MEKITIKVVKSSNLSLPFYATTEAAGMDVEAVLEQDVILNPMERALIPTGLRMEIPRGYECQIRPRSGLALHHGITILNTPGTIDADSRAEIGIIVINLSNEPFRIQNGDKICQMVFKSCVRAEWEVVDKLDKTKRGDGSFGDSGLKG